MKLSEWAKKNDKSYQTAWRWFKAGRIPSARQLETGTIVVDEGITRAEEKLKRIMEILNEE